MPTWLILLIVGIILVCAAQYLGLPPPLTRWFMFGGVVCVAIGVVLLIFAALANGGGLRLTTAAYAFQTAVERPGAVPSNPMDANAIALIGVPVVALTQLSKWANLPDQWGPAAVLVFAAIGVAVWVASYGGFHTQDLFNYFVAWITTAVASAGVFGFTRASAAAVTAVRPPTSMAAGGNPTIP